MAAKTKKELSAEASALAERLGIEVTFEGLNVAALSALVEELEGKLPPDEAPADEEPAAEPAAAPMPAPAPASAKPERVIVAPKHGIGTRSRGIRAPGDEVVPADFSVDPEAGLKRLNELLKAGYLVNA
jgi:hypothetical protein